MTRILQIFTDLVLVSLIRLYFIHLGERDKHQKIRVNYFVSRYARVVASVSSVCHCRESTPSKIHLMSAHRVGLVRRFQGLYFFFR